MELPPDINLNGIPDDQDPFIEGYGINFDTDGNSVVDFLDIQNPEHPYHAHANLLDPALVRAYTGYENGENGIYHADQDHDGLHDQEDQYPARPDNNLNGILDGNDPFYEISPTSVDVDGNSVVDFLDVYWNPDHPHHHLLDPRLVREYTENFRGHDQGVNGEFHLDQDHDGYHVFEDPDDQDPNIPEKQPEVEEESDVLEPQVVENPPSDNNVVEVAPQNVTSISLKPSAEIMDKDNKRVLPKTKGFYFDQHPKPKD
ncbi:hypothetical protein GF362_04790 [Candidatus Dojkabacteria bacterium]|nr:hypothetical protein [Candidatus Dojkabacteria bacterium]